MILRVFLLICSRTHKYSSFINVLFACLKIYRNIKLMLSLRHYATSRTIVGSIPDEVIQFFQLT
jgi:hypothetical protein